MEYIYVVDVDVWNLNLLLEYLWSCFSSYWSIILELLELLIPVAGRPIQLVSWIFVL